MTDNDKLDLILSEIQGMKADMQSMQGHAGHANGYTRVKTAHKKH